MWLGDEMLLPFAYTQGSQLIIVSNTLICGVEPAEAWFRQGISSGVNKCFRLLLASGDVLPFANNSFDAVCEFGILHHVPDPARVVQEMLRVARNVIVISDANRFGQGFLPLRILKLLLFKFKLWSALDFLRTCGKGYQVSEGGGVFYSYSVGSGRKAFVPFQSVRPAPGVGSTPSLPRAKCC